MLDTERESLLVVDDSLLIGKIVERIFEQFPIQVWYADNALDGLDMARAHQPSIILLDVVLPKYSGFELCRMLKEDMRTRDIPIIFLTGSRDVPSIAIGFQAGGVDYIEKPFSEIELRARVLTHLETLRARKEILKKNAALIRELEEKQRLLEIDKLTGVYVRQYFTERAEERAAKGKPFGLLFGDVDHFKQVNDVYGHLAGDQVLTAVAGAIQECAGPGTCTARWGGEEFVSLIPDTDRRMIYFLAERVRRSVQALRIPYQGQMLSCTITLSAMLYQLDLNLDENMALLDEGLYEGKRAGRNRCILVGEPQKRLNRTPPGTPRGEKEG